MWSEDVNTIKYVVVVSEVDQSITTKTPHHPLSRDRLANRFYYKICLFLVVFLSICFVIFLVIFKLSKKSKRSTAMVTHIAHNAS